MARQGNGKLAGVGGAIRRTAKKLTAKLRPGRGHADEPAAVAAAPKPRSGSRQQPKARPAQRPTDVPMDMIAGTYTPTQTSLKAPFRANGADRQRDQELGRGVHDTRWNDEDHLTNKSGDSRIGTHGRTYEPGERKRS